MSAAILFAPAKSVGFLAGEPFSRMAGKQGIAHGHLRKALRLEVVERVKIAEALAHLLAIDEKMLAVIPMMRKKLAVAAFALCDFVFVMREKQIDTPGMEVD